MRGRRPPPCTYCAYSAPSPLTPLLPAVQQGAKERSKRKQAPLRHYRQLTRGRFQECCLFQRHALPPHMRGKRWDEIAGLLPVPSTPTHVGQTLVPPGRDQAGRLYPHARGANVHHDSLLGHYCPLPPRTWGKLAVLVMLIGYLPSTPTHVGQTGQDSSSGSPPRLYPHARGANDRRHPTQPISQPLPPRTWGKPSSMPEWTTGRASTPTHVGQTLGRTAAGRSLTLYPHARGANGVDLLDLYRGRPLPPRTWGKPGDHPVPDCGPASTPTHVGQTSTTSRGSGESSLYPHARGANGAPSEMRATRSPLPPRTWGKHGDDGLVHGLQASTPTHVGQTTPPLHPLQDLRLYPHARGANGGDADGD